jgi:phosphatidylserine decarboxylase precursor
MSGFIYFLIALIMLFVVLMGAALLSHVSHLRLGPFKNERLRMPLWGVILGVMLNVFSLAGGFPGWVVFGSILGISEILILIACGIARLNRRAKRRAADGRVGPPPANEAPPSSSRRAPPTADANARNAPGPHSGAEAETLPGPPPLVGQQQHHHQQQHYTHNGPLSMTGTTPGRPGAPYSDLDLEDPSRHRRTGHEGAHHGKDSAHFFPASMSRSQARVTRWTGAAIIVLFFVTAIVFYASPLRFYQVYGREDGVGVTEVTPNQVVTKTNMLLYAFPGVAKALRMNLFNVWLTNSCGRRFNKELTPAQKSTEILANFINLYGIDMTLYAKPSYLDYQTVNQWFSRSLAPGKRTVSGIADDSIVVSPADARIVAYQDATASVRLWLKGQRFSAAGLLGSKAVGQDFEGGTVLVVRLAPQDYHRFHSPVTGNVTLQYAVSGPLHSVNADGMRSENDAIYNQRVVSILTTARGKKVGFVAIGAVCVGSITMITKQGDSVRKGDPFGYFEFGGSTVALIFPPGDVVIAEDLSTASALAVENLVKMGMYVARYV